MEHFKFYFLSLLLITFVSCDKSYIEYEQCEPITKSAGDGKYDVLGYGYDCAYSDFKGNRYSKLPVIDLEKFKSGVGKDPSTGVIVTFPNLFIEEAILHGSGNTDVTFGSNITEYEKTLSNHTNVSTIINNKNNEKLFSGEVRNLYKDDKRYSVKNAFMRISSEVVTRKITLSSIDPTILKYFLTDGFVYDIKRLSGMDIVKKYGTHVLTDILLGGINNIFFNAKLSTSGENSNFKNEVNSFYLLVTINSTTEQIKNSFKSFRDISIKINTLGGSAPSGQSISFNPETGQLNDFTFDYSSWMSSVNKNSEQIIGIGNPSTVIYKLSDFISDVNKKIEVDKAIETYISSVAPVVSNQKSIDYENIRIKSFDRFEQNGSIAILHEYYLYSKDVITYPSSSESDFTISKVGGVTNTKDRSWIALPYGENVYRLKGEKKNLF